MEIRQLRYFVAVAEELHFGRAADRLHIVQPAVSQQVRRLERELGMRLFSRTPRRVTLTADGRRLLGEAQSVLAAVDRVASVAAELAAGRSKTIRLGISPGLGERLGRGVARLRGSNPDVGLELVEGSATRHGDDVRAGALDFALVREPVRGAGLETVELWRDPLLALLPGGHPAAATPRLDLSRLADGVLRLPDRAADPGRHEAALAACRAAGFVARLGRPAGSLEATVVEIGASRVEWTAVYADVPRPAAAGVVERPFARDVTVPGYLVVRSGGAGGCTSDLAAAFR